MQLPPEPPQNIYYLAMFIFGVNLNKCSLVRVKLVARVNHQGMVSKDLLRCVHTP